MVDIVLFIYNQTNMFCLVKRRILLYYSTTVKMSVLGRSPPSRAGTFRRRGTFCVGLCKKFHFHKKRGESIYKYAVLCSNCEMYIPRHHLIKKEGYKKWACPCCQKNWIKGVYWQNKEVKHKKRRLTPDGPIARMLDDHDIL